MTTAVGPSGASDPEGAQGGLGRGPAGTPPDRPSTELTPPRHRRGKHRRSLIGRRRWPRRALIVANIFTALAILGAGSAYGYVQWRLGQIKRIPVARASGSGQECAEQAHGRCRAALHDARDRLGHAQHQRRRPRSAVRPPSRANDPTASSWCGSHPKTRSLALLSIPRDTLVPIPGYGTTRINTAFNSGTPSLLVSVLDQDFGIQVNHVAVFNFDTFEAVADAVGGVEQYFPTPARDILSTLNIPAAGCYNLSGAQALAFVRSREYQYYLDGQWQYQLFPESDLARIQRQQAFFKALARKAKQVAPTNPIALNDVIAGVTKNLTVDSSFSNSLLLSLAQDFRSANLSTIPSYTYPTQNSVAVPGALDPETQQGAAVIQQWLNVGQTPPPPPKAATPARAPSHDQSGVGQDRGVQRQRCRWAGCSGRPGSVSARLPTPPCRGTSRTSGWLPPRLSTRRTPSPRPPTPGPAGRRGDAGRGLQPCPHRLQPRGRHRPELQWRCGRAPRLGQPGHHPAAPRPRPSPVPPMPEPDGQPGFLLGLRRGLHSAGALSRADAADLRGVSQAGPGSALQPTAIQTGSGRRPPLGCCCG